MSVEERIKELEQYKVLANQPVIEASSEYVSYETGSFVNPLNFEDRDGFQTRFSKEAESISKLQDILETGDFFIQTLYTYRSISRALPQVKPDVAEKAKLFRRIFDVLDPEIKKIRDLLTFHTQTVQYVSKTFTELISAENRKEIPSDTMLDYLIRVLDMILKLDALKNMKAAINNDFAALKRVVSQMDRTGVDQEQLNFLDSKSEEAMIFQTFLSKNNSIIIGIRDELIKISGFDSIMVYLINRCADNFESNRFLFCDQKHCLLRVIVFGMFLIDHNKNTREGFKKLNLPRFYKIFKRYPCIPLYGDMTFTIKTVLKTCPSLPELEWSNDEKAEKKLATDYLLSNHIYSIRKEYQAFTTEFCLLVNKIKMHAKTGKDIPEAMKTSAKKLCERGIQNCANWTTLILEQAAWKYAHPADITSATELANPENPSTPTDPTQPEQPKEIVVEKKETITDYERVVRYNYNAKDRAVLVDTIAIIKGLESLLLKHTGLFAPLIRSRIHFELQEFVQVTLTDMLVRTKEKKRPIHTTVLELRNIAADWLTGPPATITKRSKKDPTPEFPKRKVAPSFTQLHMIRSILSTLFSERSPGMQSKGLLGMGKKDFDSNQVTEMKEFYDSTFMWSYLLNFNFSLRKAANLADLWYREFYLEISKKIQFPIDMSLPWILTKDIIEKSSANLMESIFYPLNLYNDAAYRALFQLQRRFLYDEIEAEVNLVFDQLVYKLTDQIYSHYKIVASNILLNNQFRVSIEKLFGTAKMAVPASRFDVLMRQRNINILGRSVDLNYLLCQRINLNIRDNLRMALLKFEASPLVGILEFESLIQVIKTTHSLLSKYLDLDPFESIFNEVNDSTSMVSFEGRIGRHITEELLLDLFKFYNYNTVTQRFVRNEFDLGIEDNEENKYEREKMPVLPANYMFGNKPFNAFFKVVNEQYKKFVGHEHVEAIIRLVGQESLALIVETCVSFIEDKLTHDLAPYVATLMEAMPPRVTLQPAAYKLEGVYGYFQMVFRDYLDYQDLKPGVFQSFRVLGNCVAFLQLLDTCQLQQNIANFMSGAPFLGIKPLSEAASKKREEMLQEVIQAENTGGSASAIVNRQNTALAGYDELFELAAIDDFFVRTDDPDNTPLVQRLKAFVSDANIQQSIRAREMSKDLPQHAARAIKMYMPPRNMMSLFKQLLERMSGFLDKVREPWKGTSPTDRLQKLDSSKEFYRLWGILQFVFCMKDPRNQGFSDFDVFGDGFYWAGCTIIYLFGQQLRFDAFNFSDHVMNINLFSDHGRDKMQDFLQTASEVRALNDRIFNVLRANYPMPQNAVQHFESPETEDFTKVRIVASVDTNRNNLDTKEFGSYRKQSMSFGSAPYSGTPSSANSPPPPPTKSSPPPPPGPPTVTMSSSAPPPPPPPPMQ